MACPSCGNTVGPTATYCGHCGTPLRRRCHICDTNNPLDAQYCQECGRTLRTQEAPNSSAEPAPEPTEGRPSSDISQPEASACPRCHTLNPANARYCDACGLPFDEEISTQQERSAGFLVRLGAFLVDAIIVGVVGAFLAAIISGGDASRAVDGTDLLVFILEAAYFTFPVARWGATPGKMVFRLRIVGVDGGRVSLGRAFGRYLASILSGLLLLIGYLMIAFRQDKRGLHDLIAETRVIYAPPVRR